MAMAMAAYEEQRSDFQFGPDVVWSELSVPAPRVVEDVGVRTMYARLARAHDAEPAVPDLGGGLPGDLFPL